MRIYVQLRLVAMRRVRPLAFRIRRKAHAEHTITIVETIDRYRSMLKPEISAELHVDVWRAGRGTVELSLKHSPSLDPRRSRLRGSARQRSQNANQSISSSHSIIVIYFLI